METANVVGNEDVKLKASLVDAGFHIQGFNTSNWFWNALSKILPPDLLRSYGSIFKDHYWSDSDRQKYSETIKSLQQEFDQRWEKELEASSHLSRWA